MRKIQLLTVLLITSTISQAQIIEWKNNYGGSLLDVSSELVQYPNGNFTVVGTSLSEDGDISNHVLVYDTWQFEVDGTGLIVQDNSYDHSITDLGVAIVLTQDDGEAILSAFVEGIPLQPLEYNLSLIKKDTNGNTEWDQTFLFDYFLTPNFELNQSNDGGFLIMCSSAGPLVGGPFTLFTTIIKTDSQGIIEWQKNYGGITYSPIDNENDPSVWHDLSIIEIPNDGFAFLTSVSDIASDASNVYGATDIWFVKIDEFGNIEWEQNFGGSDIDIAGELIMLPNGNFLLAGTTFSHNNDVSTNYGGTDCWAAEFDDNGAIIWEKNYGGSNDDGIVSIVLNDEGIVFAGDSNSSDFDVDSNQGSFDVFIFKTDYNGQLLWDKSIGGSAHDAAIDIIQPADGGLLLTAISLSNDGDFNANYGQYDIWLFKFEPEFAPLPFAVTCNVFLEGPYINQGEMQTSLLNNGLLNDVSSSEYPIATDWITISLLDENCIVIASQESILNSDGSILAIFEDVEADDYYIEVNHRNHLAVISATAWSLPNPNTSYNFTLDVNAANGVEQLKPIDGIYCMYAGDADNNNNINAQDFNAWASNSAAVNVYEPYDFDCNGIINVADFNLWFANRSKVGFTCD